MSASPVSSERSLLDRYREYVEEFTDHLLTPYVDRLETASGVRSKEFNDPVWGTITLSGAEVAVLDSPLQTRTGGHS
jgi:hypothetical protein